ncbi:hypothetical protein C8F04DRAFT_1274421 [Mycena alexandri]|uniref:Uncharacterized protein n=1 Tax=Mycena alexandri TaxID=1745969 RepID=A0AAD6WPZ4_9AGAR|nr:hypothetical protein C8F04DRAFT_1274421 [Mycena alexandri]
MRIGNVALMVCRYPHDLRSSLQLSLSLVNLYLWAAREAVNATSDQSRGHHAAGERPWGQKRSFIANAYPPTAYSTLLASLPAQLPPPFPIPPPSSPRLSFYSRHRALQPQSGTAVRGARSRAKLPFTAASSLPAPPSTARHLPIHLLHRLDEQQHGLSADNEQSVHANASACSSGERVQSAQSVLFHRMRLNPTAPISHAGVRPEAYAGGVHVERANDGVRLVLRVWERAGHWEREYEWIEGG